MKKALLALLILAASSQAQTLITHGCSGLGVNAGTSSSFDSTGGNFIALIVASLSGTAAPTDSKSNSYTGLTAYAGGDQTQQIFYTAATPTVGSGHTVTVAGTSSYASVCWEVWSTITQPSPFDTGTDSGAHANGACCVTVGPVTPSSGAKIVISGASIDQSATSFTTPSGFSNMDQVTYTAATFFGDAMASLVQANGTSVSAVWNTSGVSDVTGVMAAFKVVAATPIPGMNLVH